MKSGKLKSGLEKLNIPKPTRANPFLRDIVCLRVCEYRFLSRIYNRVYMLPQFHLTLKTLHIAKSVGHRSNHHIYYHIYKSKKVGKA
jgi:hypothetical protein